MGKAECTLKYLLSKYPQWQRDYSIAMSAISLSCVTSGCNITQQREKIKLYLQVASQICKTLNAFNSDVFVRYLFMMSSIAHTVEERDQIFNFLREIEGGQYEDVPVNGATPKVADYPAGCLSVLGDKPVRCFSQLQQTTPVSLRNLKNVRYCK